MATHPPTGSRPHAQTAALSVEAVTEAVAAVMEASDRDGVIDRAMASRIGSTILPSLTRELDGKVTSGSQLVGQQVFRSILSQHLSINAANMDDDTRRAMQKFVRENANRTGPDFAALVNERMRGGGWSGRADTHADQDDSARSESGSSMRFDETYLRSPAGRDMQAHAMRHGLSWAVDRADILRLGKDAIELFARTKFRGESFDGLREVGFQGRQIERLVRRAEDSGQDANEVARVHRDSVRNFGGNDARERQRWVDRFDAFNTNPRDAGAWHELDGALGRMEREGTQEQRDHARRQREVSERIRQSTLQLNVGAVQANAEARQVTVVAGQAAVATNQAVVANAQVDQGIEGLNAPPPAASPAATPATSPPVVRTASAPHP